MFNSNTYNNNYTYNNPNASFPQSLGNPNSFSSNFTNQHSLIEQQQNINNHNTLHDNLNNDIKNEVLKEYQITVDSLDRNIINYPNQFSFRLSFGNNSSNDKPLINRSFRNVKYIKIDSMILPTYSDIKGLDKDIDFVHDRFVVLKLNNIINTSQLGTNDFTNSTNILMYPKVMYGDYALFKPVNKDSSVIWTDNNNLLNLSNIEFNLLDGKYDNINWMQYKFNELKDKEISDIEKQNQLNEYILDVTKQIVINLRVGVIENKINTEINYR